MKGVPTKCPSTIARVSRSTAASGFISGLWAERLATATPWASQISFISSGSSSIDQEWKYPTSERRPQPVCTIGSTKR
jgi:hypothetical protein